MKEGWEYKKLGEVAEVIHGKNQKDVLSANGTYPIYGSGGNVMGYASDYLCEAGTTILGRKGSINNPLYIKERFWNVDTAFGISAKEGNDGKYLYYFIKTVDWLKKNTGTTLPSLTQQVVKSVVLPVPPLSEQQRIVDYLDSAFAKIDAMKANAEKSLNEAKTLFQASLKEMLEPKEGWEYKKLGDVIDHLRTGLNPRTHFKLNTPDAEGYYITVRELKGFAIKPDEKTDKVNRSAIQRINERSNLKIGDVLFSGTGTIGKTALVSELPENWNIKEGVYAMTPKHSEIDSRYLIYYIGSDFFLRLVNDKAAGTGVRSIPMKELVKLPLSVPPLYEQQRIVATLDTLKSKVDRLQANFEKISQECDALKQAILKKIFE